MTLLAGRYELGEELGSGGMARVVAGHDRELDRPVAVKLLHLTSDRTARQRFLREARTAARFHHPNAVAVHDAGEDEGQPYIVMELVRGRTLADLLASDGPLPVDEVIAIVTGVLDALAAAHARGLVHRDVKPANVLLPEEGGVKLADFGIAKALDDATSGLTSPGTVVGTVSYVAPELVEGGAATPASDVYSVACVLFEALTGRPPHGGDTPLSVAYAHVRSPVPPIRELRPEVPPDLAAVVERSLAKDPGQRYADAAEMRAALLEGPEATPPPTLPLAGAGAIVGDAPTRALATDPGADRWRVSPIVVVVALLLLAAIAVLVADGRGGDDVAIGVGEAEDQVDAPPDGPDPADDPEPAPADDAAADPMAEEDVGADEGEPTALAQLIARLSDAPPGTYGEKQDDLLDDLVALSRETDRDERAKEAADLREDVADWVEKGELDPVIGAEADAVLAGLASG